MSAPTDDVTTAAPPSASLGAAAVARQAELQDHTIVCGLSPLGMRIVQLHQAGAPVVVLDDDPDRRLTALLAHWGVPYVDGSPRQADELAAVGAARLTPSCAWRRATCRPSRRPWSPIRSLPGPRSSPRSPTPLSGGR